MRRFILAVLVVIAGPFVSATAHAAIVTGAFEGEIYSGTTSLLGKAISGTFTINDELLVAGEGCDPALQYNCRSGAYSVEITHVIDGLEFKYSGTYGYAKVVDRYPIAFTGPAYDQLYLQTGADTPIGMAYLSIISFDTNFIQDLDFAVSFDAFAPFFDTPSSGYSSIGYGYWSEEPYLFRINSASASFSGDPSYQVPEPESLFLLGLGLAGLAFTRHRRQSEARTLRGCV